MRRRPGRIAPGLGLLLALLAGCATTKVETSGATLAQPLCEAGQPPVPVAIYWAPAWRADQKEPAARELAARRGIERFARDATCLSVLDVERLPAGPESDAQLVARARASAHRPQRIVSVTVRELGPRLVVGLPMIVEGGTEVVIDVQVLDLREAPEPRLAARQQTRWRHGGTLVIKGVKTLEQDMAEALKASLFKPPGEPQPAARSPQALASPAAPAIKSP